MTKRFILDTSTGLCHDLNYIHENCQINKLDSKHIFDAESLDEDFRMMINLDGEYGGDAPMTFENLKQHIEIYANLDEIPDSAVSGDIEMEEASDYFIKELEQLTNEDIDGDGKISRNE